MRTFLEALFFFSRVAQFRQLLLGTGSPGVLASEHTNFAELIEAPQLHLVVD